MITTNKIASEVYRVKTKQTEQNVFFDPVTLSIIASILKLTVVLLQKCTKDADEATQVVYKPNDVQLSQFKRILRRKLGWWKYWKEGQEYIDAFQQVGYNITKTDMEQMYNEQRTMEYRV